MIEKYKKILMERISEIIPLTKIQGGKHTLYKTNCLLDKNHFMYYNESDGTFTCPVCGFSKDIITLCSEIKNVDEWVMLEKIFKIKLKMDTRPIIADAGKEMFKNELLFQINYDAMLFFEEQLQESPEAMKYLIENRGLTKETIRKFHLGYAPKYNKLHRTLRRDFDEEDLVAAGIIGKDEKTGKYYDVFKDRIIFPIIDRNEQILGFGGRTLGDNNSKKYINTRTTEIFHKSSCLYALNMVNLSAKPNRILVCEGYMDVIALHQEGIDWAVGTLGTALTFNHYKQLKNITDHPTVIFDGDDAGINAANRVLQKVGKLDVLTLPEGKDPDEYIKDFGKNAFLQYVNTHTKTWEEYWLDQYDGKENVFEYFLKKMEFS